MDYDIQRLCIENLNDIARIHKSVYKRDFPLDTLHKKYDTAYLGISYCGYIAYFNGEPVAFYGVIPTASHWGDKTEISAQSMDSMTVEAHQRKGLFGLLANKTCDLAKEIGITFIWGFGTDVSERPVIDKVGFRCDERVRGYRFAARKRGLDKLLNKVPSLRSMVENRILRILQKHISQRTFQGSLHTLTEYPMITRNEAYFSYKRYNTTFIIELENVLFWIKLHPHHGIMVGDIEAGCEAQLRIGILAFKALADRHGLGAFTFQTSPGTFTEKVAAELADESFPSWGVCYRSLTSEFPLEKLKVTWGDLDTF